MTKPDAEPQNMDFSQEELEAIKDQGKKLGFLLKRVDIPEEVKQELASLVQYMSPEQIDRLVEVLEVRHGMERTADTDKELKENLERIVQDFQQQREQLNKDLTETLYRFNKNLKL
jgi:uncharacterized protein YpuA (DUF1002 family)